MEFIQKAEKFFTQLQYNLAIDPEPFLEDPETGKLQSLTLEPDIFFRLIDKFGIDYPFNADNKINELKSLYKKDKISSSNAGDIIMRLYMQYWDLTEVMLFQESEDKLYEALRKFNPNITEKELLIERQSYVSYLNEEREEYHKNLFNPIMEDHFNDQQEELNKSIDWDAEREMLREEHKREILQAALLEDALGRRLVRTAQTKVNDDRLDLEVLEKIRKTLTDHKKGSNTKLNGKIEELTEEYKKEFGQFLNPIKKESDSSLKTVLGITDPNKLKASFPILEDFERIQDEFKKDTEEAMQPRKKELEKSDKQAIVEENRESTEDFLFKNNFDDTPVDEVYDHFYAGLIYEEERDRQKDYLSKSDLDKFLKAAFEDKKPPKKLFTFNNYKTTAQIYKPFHRYFKDVAVKRKRTEAEKKKKTDAAIYASLLEDHFRNWTSVKTNFSKYGKDD